VAYFRYYLGINIGGPTKILPAFKLRKEADPVSEENFRA
jgi:hypothetical protein